MVDYFEIVDYGELELQPLTTLEQTIKNLLNSPVFTDDNFEFKEVEKYITPTIPDFEQADYKIDEELSRIDFLVRDILHQYAEIQKYIPDSVTTALRAEFVPVYKDFVKKHKMILNSIVPEFNKKLLKLKRFLGDPNKHTAVYPSRDIDPIWKKINKCRNNVEIVQDDIIRPFLQGQFTEGVTDVLENIHNLLTIAIGDQAYTLEPGYAEFNKNNFNNIFVPEYNLRSVMTRKFNTIATTLRDYFKERPEYDYRDFRTFKYSSQYQLTQALYQSGLNTQAPELVNAAEKRIAGLRIEAHGKVNIWYQFKKKKRKPNQPQYVEYTYFIELYKDGSRIGGCKTKKKERPIEPEEEKLFQKLEPTAKLTGQLMDAISIHMAEEMKKAIAQMCDHIKAVLHDTKKDKDQKVECCILNQRMDCNPGRIIEEQINDCKEAKKDACKNLKESCKHLQKGCQEINQNKACQKQVLHDMHKLCSGGSKNPSSTDVRPIDPDESTTWTNSACSGKYPSNPFKKPETDNTLDKVKEKCHEMKTDNCKKYHQPCNKQKKVCSKNRNGSCQKYLPILTHPNQFTDEQLQKYINKAGFINPPSDFRKVFGDDETQFSDSFDPIDVNSTVQFERKQYQPIGYIPSKENNFVYVYEPNNPAEYNKNEYTFYKYKPCGEDKDTNTFSVVFEFVPHKHIEYKNIYYDTLLIDKNEIDDDKFEDAKFMLLAEVVKILEKKCTNNMTSEDCKEILRLQHEIMRSVRKNITLLNYYAEQLGADKPVFNEDKYEYKILEYQVSQPLFSISDQLECVILEDGTLQFNIFDNNEYGNIILDSYIRLDNFMKIEWDKPHFMSVQVDGIQGLLQVVQNGSYYKQEFTLKVPTDPSEILLNTNVYHDTFSNIDIDVHKVGINCDNFMNLENFVASFIDHINKINPDDVHKIDIYSDMYMIPEKTITNDKIIKYNEPIYGTPISERKPLYKWTINKNDINVYHLKNVDYTNDIERIGVIRTLDVSQPNLNSNISKLFCPKDINNNWVLSFWIIFNNIDELYSTLIYDYYNNIDLKLNINSFKYNDTILNFQTNIHSRIPYNILIKNIDNKLYINIKDLDDNIILDGTIDDLTVIPSMLFMRQSPNSKGIFDFPNAEITYIMMNYKDLKLDIFYNLINEQKKYILYIRNIFNL